MTFPQAIRHSLERYAVFSGRASRAEFWWFQLFNFLGTFATGFLDGLIAGTNGGVAVLSAIWALALLLPSISVLVRRLHDIDRTGWWFWIMLLPMIGMIVLLVFTLIRGTEGPNRYGPSPSRDAASRHRAGNGTAPDARADAGADARADGGSDAALSRSRIPTIPRGTADKDQ